VIGWFAVREGSKDDGRTHKSAFREAAAIRAPEVPPLDSRVIPRGIEDSEFGRLDIGERQRTGSSAVKVRETVLLRDGRGH
jgi:hypothetical protein